MPSSASAGMEVTTVALLFAGFVSGVVLYVIGSLMDHHERVQRDREWRDRRGK